MSETQKHTKPNVPNLRFPGFSGEWKSKRIGEDCAINMCKRIFANQTEEQGDVPFFKIGTIGGVPDAYISKALFEEYKAKYNYPRKCEVMITCAGTVGKTIVFDGTDAYFQDSNIVWISNPKQLYINMFLYYFLSRVNWNKLNSTTITRIYNDNLRDLVIQYPSVKEQERIAALLSLLDQRIAIQNKVIEKYESLIKALYSRLLPLEVDKTAELGSLVQICKGKQLNGEFLSDEGKYYVMNGGITPSGYYDEYNTPAGTISISEGGNSCGFVQYNEKPFWSGGHCYTLLQTTDERIQYKFLYHFLKSKQDEIMALRIGSGLPNIQKKDIGRFPVPILPIDYQNAITRLLDTVDKYIWNEQAILVELTHQKSCFLGNLFI